MNKSEYTLRINRVLDYIQDNMAEELSLNQLAKVAHFSPFHFHRIFHSLMGETCSQFIKRIRLESAATKLLYNPKQSITEISYDCGFSSPETFARAFKEKFGESATTWRTKNKISNIQQEHSKNGKIVSKHPQVINISPSYYGEVNKIRWRITMKKETTGKAFDVEVVVKELEPMHVAYVRHMGPYQGDGELFGHLFQKLFQWAGPRDLITEDSKVMAVYHDNPEITDDNKLRVSICITAPEGTKVSGDINTMIIEGGKYAIGSFELTEQEYQSAWDTMYGAWLPESGFQPDDRHSFELFKNDPHEHPEGKHLVDIYIPVKPL